jgi:hypothetical protein
MEKCFLYHKPLRFARILAGILLLIGYFWTNLWYILIVGLLLFLSAFSEKTNLFYQIYPKKGLKREEGLEHDKGEIAFAWGLASIFVLVAVFLLFLKKYIILAKILILLTSVLFLFAGFAGVCVASIMYAFFFKRKKKG